MSKRLLPGISKTLFNGYVQKFKNSFWAVSMQVHVSPLVDRLVGGLVGWLVTHLFSLGFALLHATNSAMYPAC